MGFFFGCANLKKVVRYQDLEFTPLLNTNAKIPIDTFIRSTIATVCV